MHFTLPSVLKLWGTDILCVSSGGCYCPDVHEAEHFERRLKHINVREYFLIARMNGLSHRLANKFCALPKALQRHCSREPGPGPQGPARCTGPGCVTGQVAGQGQQ